MNYKMVAKVLGKILLIEALLMCFPLVISLIYKENTYLSYVIPIAGLAVLGIPSLIFRPKDSSIYAKEGFVITAFAWVLLSLAGAIPFVVSGAIPSYVNALFETVSGFTTTGATILSDVEALPRSILFWRSFVQWVGGMGVLVFMLAILPESNSAGIMHVYRAESPGPKVGKLVSKIKFTARILYGIYIVLTVVEVIFLVCGKMPLFDSIVHAFATAGTGGFSIKNASIAYYDSVYIEMVIAVFMFLFGINFNIFYLLLVRNVGRVVKSEELRVYFCITVAATLLIACDLLSVVGNFGEAMRYSFFQVTSVSSTTGFCTADFNTWPTFSKCMLLLLMMIGSCAGSTCGGMKVSRLIILTKSGFSDIRKMVRPRSVISLKFEGETLNPSVVNAVRTHFCVIIALIILTTLLISIDGYGDFTTNLSASIACVNTVGPGLGLVGPLGNYEGYSALSKILLSIDMLAGRLEVFPILILFSASTWKRR